MSTEYVDLKIENIDDEHICCAFSDKKCAEGYKAKKEWLKREFGEAYVFRRLNERAKVFIEYVPAEKAWTAVEAPDYIMINCFWVSGQYKGKGHGYALLQSVIEDAKRQGKRGLVSVAGTKKLPFMSDTKWLLAHGFKVVEKLPYGFALIAMKFDETAPNPAFLPCVAEGCCGERKGLTAYYSSRCPFTDYYVNKELKDLARKHAVPLEIIKLETREQARMAPSPNTIFSLFMDGKFVGTDLSLCTEKKFEKLLSGTFYAE